MGAVRRLDHPLDHHPADQQALDGGVDGQACGVDDLLAAEVGALGGHAEQVVEVGVRTEVRRVAVHVRPVQVNQRDVEVEGGYGDELLVVGVRAGDRLQVGVVDHHVRAEAGPHREEREALGRRAQPGLEHALVELDDLGDGAVLASQGEVGLERDRVERDERVDELAHLAGPDEQADVGASPADDGEVLQVGAKDRADQRHRLAPGSPAADADGHPVLELGDDLLDGHLLVAGLAAHFSPAVADRLRCRRTRRAARRRRRRG